jgi:arylsulfatase A-like enzyme
MFRVPGITPAGGVCQRFVSLQDIYPTLVDLCGLERPDYLDGRSLMPLLKDPSSAWESTAITCLTDKGTPEKGYVTIRNELGRYIHYQDGQEEFYDTKRDPHEWTNAISNPEYAAVVGELKAVVPTGSDMAVPLPCLMDAQGQQTGKKRR